MIEDTNTQVNPPNRWRLETPGAEGWKRTARPGDPDKYLMIRPIAIATNRAVYCQSGSSEVRARLPHIETDEKGVKWMVSEGWQKSRAADFNGFKFEGEDALRAKAGNDPEKRIKDHLRDGVEAEIIFPNKGLLVWATLDGEFATPNAVPTTTGRGRPSARTTTGCRRWRRLRPPTWKARSRKSSASRRWDFAAWRCPASRCTARTIRAIPITTCRFTIRCGQLIQDTGLPITYHISTGRDPRAARKDGGAVINYVSHSLSPTIEPIANMCASGVLERFPGLRFAAIECGIGWVPWALQAMDEAYHKHHMWAYPKLKMLPSEYFKQHGSVSFQEDPVGLDLAVKYGLVDNFMWANDYPHHEGSWPHSAQAIERQMGHLTDDQRAKILGLNAARMFKFDVDALLQRRKAIN